MALRFLLLMSAAVLAAWNAGAQTRATPLIVTDTRLNDAGLPGAAPTVLTADDIARQPGNSLADLLKRQAGVQMRSLNGRAGSGVLDLRGFGEAGGQNALVLINGRRLHDLDLAAVNLASLPLDAIDRVEILRGHAGAALYGDAAVGGAINIVTKTAAGPNGWTAKAMAGVGSHDTQDADLSAAFRHDGFSAALFASGARTDGYRDNAEAYDRALSGEARLDRGWGSLYAQFGLDSMDERLPGALAFGPGFFGGFDDALKTRPTSSSSPNDWREEKGGRITLGGAFDLTPGLSLILDGGFRRKDQRAFIFSSVDTRLDHWSFTPRLEAEWAHGGVTAGLDLTHADYHSVRAQNFGTRPVHVYDATQTSASFYAQNHYALTPALTLGAGLRLQSTWVEARDRFDAGAPGGAFDAARTGVDDQEFHWMGHLGLDYAVDEALTLSARAGRAVRLPNIDERIGGPNNRMNLAAQTSWDFEGGARYETDRWHAAARAFVMLLRDEIAFNPYFAQNAFGPVGANFNYDPTQRAGLELEAGADLFEDWRLTGNVTFVRATFRDGPFAGNEVPLVAPLVGNITLTYTPFEWLTIANSLRMTDARRLGNDQPNTALARIPGSTQWDAKLSGEYGALLWSLDVENILDQQRFETGFASQFVAGRYSGFPLPGRTVMLRLGAQF